MAVESVALAASVAGLLSLGLQITGGIVKYMDAFEGRGEELRNVKKQNDNLAVTLHAMKTMLAGLQGQSPAIAAAVDQNIRSCEEDLRALEALCIELSDHAGSTWTKQLENKKKKATFAFHRPKLRDLELQLQKAQGSLQLIQGSLGLETSNRNTALLAAIQSSSRDQASELLLVRSEVAAFATPVAGIHDKLPGLQSSVDQTRQLIVAHSGAIEVEVHESSQRVRHDLQQAHNSIIEHIKTIDHKVQLLGEENISLRALALRAASKPAALKSLCDDMELSRKRCNPGNASQLSKSHRERTSSDPSQNLWTGLEVGRGCICPSPTRSFMQVQMQRGYTYLSGEWGSQGHWSSCPLSKTPRKQRLKASLKYTGVSRLLKSVIEISFALTSGAGGCSISPSFTYSPTADVNSDPAFRLMEVIRSSQFTIWMNLKFRGPPMSNRQRFFIAGLRKLAKLLEERRTYPTAVDDQNRTLMHYAAETIIYLTFGHQLRPGEMKALAEFFPALLSYGVPAFSYDTRGFSPLHYLMYPDDDWEGVAVEALSRANLESQPAILNWSPRDMSTSRFSILSLDRFPEVAIAFACGPLSMAIVNSDLDEVNRVLERFPGSIAELDIYGRSPFHLAAAKPEILKRLVKAADLSILNQRDRAGCNALDIAMTLSSRNCINRKEYVRCKGCSCYLCAKYLLDAGCNIVRAHGIRKANSDLPSLVALLRESSELARRHYVFHMRKSGNLRTPGHALTNKSLSTKQDIGEKRTTSDIQGSILQAQTQLQICDESDELINSTSGWVFQQIESIHLAQLFYRHGFIPSPSIFLQLLLPNALPLRDSLTPEIVCWLLDHGGDLFLRLSVGPINKTANDGVFAAHYVFFLLGQKYWERLQDCQETLQYSIAFKALKTTVTCRNLTDGCCCPCSTRGCSPFTWMMKGFVDGELGTLKVACSNHAKKIADYYSSCSPDITLLTYVEAIRFMTFEALDMAHSCCDPNSLVEKGAAWIDMYDPEIIEEQTFLLKLHELLVVEFTQKASEYLGDGANSIALFPQFWKSYWKDRMAEELEKLNRKDLTAAERRDAEEIGVVWHNSTESDDSEDGNPYHWLEMEHYFFELDRICPEYNEPWPEGLRRIH